MQDLTRARSIDVLRGLDVLLMLFVNEMAGVTGTPAFLRHVSRDADGMTITDVVFPAFLFIVGMAIPFALAGRLRRESAGAVWRHVLTRTTSLLVIGVLMIAPERACAGPLSPHLWNVLMTVGVVLAWQAGSGPRYARLRAAGFALLVAVVLLYCAEGGTGFIQLRPSWWGILGLIGWAYLVAAGLYLLLGDRLTALAGAIPLLYCVYLADVAGQAPWLKLPHLSVGPVLGSHGAVVVAGVVLGLMLARHRREGTPPRGMILGALGYAAALAWAAFLLHQLSHVHRAFAINKIGATLPWCLYSSAITTAAWAVLYWIVDVRGVRRIPGVVLVAGENALVAYLLAPLLLSLFALTAPLFGGTDPYARLGATLWVGTLRSIVFLWIVVRLCGLMRKHGLGMHL